MHTFTAFHPNPFPSLSNCLPTPAGTFNHSQLENKSWGSTYKFNMEPWHWWSITSTQINTGMSLTSVARAIFGQIKWMSLYPHGWLGEYIYLHSHRKFPCCSEWDFASIRFQSSKQALCDFASHELDTDVNFCWQPKTQLFIDTQRNAFCAATILSLKLMCEFSVAKTTTAVLPGA